MAYFSAYECPIIGGVRVPITYSTVFMDVEDEGEPLTCNTEKDKSFHLHRHTAGEYIPLFTLKVLCGRCITLGVA